MKNPAAVVVAMLLVVAPAHAQRGGKVPALRALTACMDESDAGRRLACYDRQVGLLAKAEDAGEVVITDRERIRQSEQASLGLRDRRPSGGTADQPVQITATIRAVREIGRDKWLFTLDNGMRWRQADDERIFPREGQSVVVRTASLGGYSMKIGSQSIRVVRVS